MRAILSVIILLVCVTLSNSQSKSDSFVPDEIVIRFAIGMVDTTFMFGNKSMTLVPKKLIRNASLDSLLRNETVIEMRKLVKSLPETEKKSMEQSPRNKALLDFSSSVMVLKVANQTDILALCEKLNSIRGVVYAEPNWYSQIDNTTPNDSYFNAQKSLYNTESGLEGHINATRAWDFTTGSVDVKVGILDTGIDYHHEDLGNGLYGVTGAVVLGGHDYVNNDNDPDDDHISSGNNLGSHGTRVTGIIGARWNNSTGVAGIAGGLTLSPLGPKPGARIYAFKIANQNGSSTVTNMATAIVEGAVPYYGIGCHILNISSGGNTYSELMRDAIGMANQFGTLIIAAKGNNGSTSVHYPADYDKEWILAVGASTGDGTRYYESNYGGGIDVVAPGYGGMIYTTARVEDGSYGSFLNTSAAAPHVAGLAALIKSIDISLHPNDVEGIIKASADRTTGDDNQYDYVNEFHPEMGHGKIDAGKALEMMHSPWQLTQHTWTGGSTFSTTGMYTMNFKNNRGGPLNGNYKVIRHTVRITPGTTLYTDNEFYAWGRSVGASSGWSNASNNYQLGFTEVIGKGTQNVSLQTYVYKVYTNSSSPVFLGWYPSTPANVVFAYSLLGRPEYNVVINGPDLLEQGQQGTWIASPINCSATPTVYQWYKKLFSSSSWTLVGNTTDTYSATISANTNLRCDVTCNGVRKPGYKNVYYDNGQFLRVAETNPVISAHPNPTTGDVEINSEISGSIRIVVYNQLGQVIAEQRNSASGKDGSIFKTQGWEQGFYIVRVFYEKGRTEQLKLYKQ